MFRHTLVSLAASLLVAAVVLPASAKKPKDDPSREATQAPDAPADSEFRQDIRRLMELTGAGEMGTQVMDQMIGMFQQSNLGVPPEFWESFMAEVDADELVELVVPIYERHLTHEDVKGLIAFYETPLGRKMVAKQPQIIQESMLAGQTWGQRIGEEVVSKLQEQGY